MLGEVGSQFSMVALSDARDFLLQDVLGPLLDRSASRTAYEFLIVNNCCQLALKTYWRHCRLPDTFETV